MFLAIVKGQVASLTSDVKRLCGFVDIDDIVQLVAKVTT